MDHSQFWHNERINKINCDMIRHIAVITGRIGGYRVPFITSQNPVVMNNLAQALLASLFARPAAALLQTPIAHLYIVGPTPVLPTSTVSQFVEASFSGYSSVALAGPYGPVLLPGTDGWGLYVDANYEAANPLTTGGQNVLGYWVDNGSTLLYMAELFSDPIPIAFPGDFVALSVIFGQPNYLQVD
jgi:hypothetical protein